MMMLIKSKQEVEIFRDLPLFDADIPNNFIDEWFEDTSLTIDDLQLPTGISVTFQGCIAKELSIAQKVIEQKNKIDHEKAVFKKHMAKLSVTDVQKFKLMLADLKAEFQRRRDEAKGSRE